jgi:NMD protein affecting ribosome stability and mRNA decay
LVTKRKPRQAFVPEQITNSKASICQNCYENNITSKLVEYPKDEHFKICNCCGSIYNIRMLRYESLPEPLGSRGSGAVKFEVVESSKHRRSRVNRDSEPTEDPAPLLNGKKDADLEILLSGNAILVSCVDNNVQEIEEE